MGFWRTLVSSLGGSQRTFFRLNSDGGRRMNAYEQENRITDFFTSAKRVTQYCGPRARGCGTNAWTGWKSTHGLDTVAFCQLYYIQG